MLSEIEKKTYRENLRADIKAISGYDDWKQIPRTEYGKFIGKIVGNYLILSGIIKGGKSATISEFQTKCITNGKIEHHLTCDIFSGRLYGVGTGCVKREKIKTHVGEKHGKLTLLEHQTWSEDGHKKRGFKCQCDCGHIVEHVLWDDIRHGYATSCGHCNDMLIAVGDRFGKLTAVTPIFDDNQELTAWYCKCDCGNAINVSVDELVNGKVSDCGCINHEENQLDRMKDSVRDDFLSLVKSENEEVKPYHLFAVPEELYTAIESKSLHLFTTPSKFVVAAIKMALAGFDPNENEPVQKELF